MENKITIQGETKITIQTRPHETGEKLMENVPLTQIRKNLHV